MMERLGWRRRLARAGAIGLLSLGLGMGPAMPAQAWDPSTTHVALVREAVLRSQLHRRWMEQSGMQRGVFSSLRLDPARLSEDERRTVELAVRAAHAGSGAVPLGGPGACPATSAPASTRLRCIEGDLWETTAIGWMQLGVVVETTPRRRLLHHFVDFQDPASTTWVDRDLPKAVLRARDREAGGSLAARLNRTDFAGRGPSAIAWLDDPNDPWAPPATREHLRKAALATDAAERDHHLARALIGVGALLHVLQDLAVPAHARGDLTAFFAPLSPHAGDRGLPLQEFVRMTYGRHRLPAAVPLGPRGTDANEATEATSTLPPATDLRALVLGTPDEEGLVHFAGRRFLSESRMPAPQAIDPKLSAEAAAAVLLAGFASLDPAEIEGAKLSPWPAPSGYLLTSTGRGLAAFDTDPEGRIRLYLDRGIYRAQAAHLLPKSVEVSARALDLLFAAFPAHTFDPDANALELDVNPGLQDPVITVFFRDAGGAVQGRRRLRLRPGQRNRIDAIIPAEAPGGRVFVQLEAKDAKGRPVVVTQTIEKAPPRPTSTTPKPRIEPGRATPDPTQTEPEPTGTEPTGTEPTGTEPTGTEPTGPEPTGTEPGQTPAEPAPSKVPTGAAPPTGTPIQPPPTGTTDATVKTPRKPAAPEDAPKEDEPPTFMER